MAQNNSKAKYKVTGKRPAPKKPSGARAGKDAFKKESSGFLKQFLPFILFIVALLLLISFFVEDFGAVGNFIRDKVLFGIFSVSLYFLPALLVAVGVLLLTDNEDKKIAYAVWCSVVGFLLIDVMCHLLFAPDDVVGNFNPFLHFQYGMNKQGGGFIGGFFGGLLTVCFSKIGAYIIVGAVVVILVMVILKKTPKDAAKGIKDALNDRRDRRKALRAEEEAKRKRLEREAREIEKEHQLSLAEAQRAAEENPVYDPTAYEGERKTEFDPDILGEDFAKEEFTSANEKEKDEILEPVAKSGDGAPELDPSILEADDDTVLDMLSKTYLGGDGLKVETSDLDPTLDGGEAVIPPPPEYVFPDIDLLVEDTAKKTKDTKRELEDKEEKLIQTLEKFNVHTESAGLPQKGPTVTRYELRPAPGTRVRAIVNLVDDIALSLATGGIRIEAPIPGKSAVGIEVPNDERTIVRLRTLIDSAKFRDADSLLTVALGEDVAGAPIFFDIAKMPHILVAGATNMGKSVCINCMIISMLYRAKPDEVKFIFIDPKKVEFNVYEGLPHLIVPVVSDMKKAAGALSWAVNEMERRYALLEEAKVRNIAGYNELAALDGEIKPLPRIVIFIDELADLMMTAPDSVESSITRLAAKARAAGLHLVIGTQRPSVDVITGTIKNNIPSRIACTVASQIDSRTIIDMPGAEKLLGRGDMLFNPVGAMKPIRVQGAFVTDAEINSVVEFIKDHSGEESAYNDAVMNEIETEAVRCTATKRELAAMDEAAELEGDEDPMFWRAVELAVESGKISTSLIQRKCSLGFGRAAKLIDRMEELGFVSAPDGQKPRQVLITRERLAEIKMGAAAGSNEPADEAPF